MFYKMRGISLGAENLLASQEELRSMGLIIYGNVWSTGLRLCSGLYRRQYCVCVGT